MTKIFSLALVFAFAALAGTPSNSVPNGAVQEIGVRAGGLHFDNLTRQVIYYGHVVVTNASGRLSCERLTIDLPPENAADSHPTNAVADINLDIIYVDNRGKTNHLVAGRGIYTYSVVNAVTNEMFTFTQHATNFFDGGWLTGEPLTYDVQKQEFNAGSNVETIFKIRSNGTNGSPFNLSP
ncbi:MAG TPA: hypothetical protein VL970_01220 [Candidatus Acidoferrales bacterium]|nr:hypothetical protein [Candidatus Acidoferrales bacterium]